jgi:NAD(P)-dependent dehydrogenase (short-subunit alcohol dehydrogenase family)
LTSKEGRMTAGLEGRKALVTGAGSGIGRACAEALAREGVVVLATDIDATAASETMSSIQAAGGQARARRLDVTDEAAWGATIGEIEAAWSALHILVNNAALCILAPALEMTLADWRRQTAVNLDGVFLGARAATPLIARSGGGSIVNISSVAGLKGVPGLSGYCATKGGVRLFTKALALECAQARNGVRVNSIHPGSIETPIWLKMRHGGALPDLPPQQAERVMRETRAAGASVTPLGVSGTPADVAAGVVYLCSDGAKFVTGAELVIDGGVMAA